MRTAQTPVCSSVPSALRYLVFVLAWLAFPPPEDSSSDPLERHVQLTTVGTLEVFKEHVAVSFIRGSPQMSDFPVGFPLSPTKKGCQLKKDDPIGCARKELPKLRLADRALSLLVPGSGVGWDRLGFSELLQEAKSVHATQVL